MMDCDKCVRCLGIFAGGVLFGSAGIQLLTSADAKKIYTHVTAAVLRMKEAVMETVTSAEENIADILASAEEINAHRRDFETEFLSGLDQKDAPEAEA